MIYKRNTDKHANIAHPREFSQKKNACYWPAGLQTNRTSEIKNSELFSNYVSVFSIARKDFQKKLFLLKMAHFTENSIRNRKKWSFFETFSQQIVFQSQNPYVRPKTNLLLIFS